MDPRRTRRRLARLPGRSRLAGGADGEDREVELLLEREEEAAALLGRDTIPAVQRLHRGKVAPEQRRRLLLALEQEFDLPVLAVRASRLTAADRLAGASQQPNLEPVGVLEVSFAVNDGLGARLLAGRRGLGFRLVVLIPPGS